MGRILSLWPWSRLLDNMPRPGRLVQAGARRVGRLGRLGGGGDPYQIDGCSLTTTHG